MTITRTELGRQVLKERSGALTPRQRSALFLVDGKRSLDELKAAAAAAGASDEDIEQLFKLGMVEAARPLPKPVVPVAGPVAPVAGPGALSPQERYAHAYPIAVQLTSELGLRGFRLNLAVEGATTYEALVEIAPRIREAVGDKRYSALDMALHNYLPTQK